MKRLALAVFLALAVPVAGCVPQNSVVVTPELAQRQSLLAAETMIQDVFSEIGFLVRAGKLNTSDIDALRPYADAVMSALRVARAAVMQGLEAQNLIDGVNKALQELIVAKNKRQGAI